MTVKAVAWLEQDYDDMMLLRASGRGDPGDGLIFYAAGLHYPQGNVTRPMFQVLNDHRYCAFYGCPNNGEWEENDDD